MIVTTPHISALRDADKVASILKSYRFSRVWLAVNMVRKDFIRRGEIISPFEISAALRVPLAAALPEEDKVFLHNIFERSRAFRALAACIASGELKKTKHREGV